jgi:hypothetical protein
VYVLCVDSLTYILDISPASGNKSVPVGLATAVAATEDPSMLWWLRRPFGG